MENERAGGWVSEPQGKRKKSSSTLEAQHTLMVLGVVVVVGVVLEGGAVRHAPTVVLVQWTMNSTILRQWVERLVHGAPF